MVITVKSTGAEFLSRYRAQYPFLSNLNAKQAKASTDHHCHRVSSMKCSLGIMKIRSFIQLSSFQVHLILPRDEECFSPQMTLKKLEEVNWLQLLGLALSFVTLLWAASFRILINHCRDYVQKTPQQAIN